jgi:hypothetical protein
MKILINFLLSCLIGTCVFTLTWFIDHLTGEPFGINGVGVYVIATMAAVYLVYLDIKSTRGYWEDLE